MRQELRLQKRQRYLDAAVTIVMRDGFDGLTMTSIAREVDAAVGTIYGYFHSKSSLIAELQVYAIDTLVLAWANAHARWAAVFAERGLDERERSIAELLSFAEYFADIQRDYPEEFRLQQMQLADRSQRFNSDDLRRLVPAAAELLRGPFNVVEAAAVAELIDQPDLVFERSVTLALTLSGVGLASNVPFAAELIDFRRVTQQVIADLVIGWGADSALVREMSVIVAEVAVTNPLASLDGYESHLARAAASDGHALDATVSDGTRVIDLSSTHAIPVPAS